MGSCFFAICGITDFPSQEKTVLQVNQVGKIMMIMMGRLMTIMKNKCYHMLHHDITPSKSLGLLVKYTDEIHSLSVMRVTHCAHLVLSVL